MATRDSTENPKLSNEQRAELTLELIRTNDLLDLAAERADGVNDSPLQTLLATAQDRVQAIARIMGIDPIEIEVPAEAAAEAQVTQ